MKIDQVFLTGLIGLLSGALGSLIAPWIKWGIEKRKMRLEYRINVINDIRELATMEPFDRVKIINSPSYKIIRDQLTQSTRDKLERPLFHIICDLGNPAIDFEKNGLLEDLALLQKRWKIV